MVNYLAARLKQAEIKVDGMVIVDAADGGNSDTVDRTASDNADKVFNIWEGTGGDFTTSHGAPMVGKEGQVENTDLTNESYNGHSITHGNIDEKSIDQVVEAVRGVFDSLKEGEKKVYNKKELKELKGH